MHSVGRLVRAGHKLSDIKEYGIPQFLMLVDIEDQLDALARISFVTDVGTVAGAMYSKSDPLGEHIGLLLDTSRGVKEWQQKQN